MPIAIATCWLSATARIAMPVRLLRKNQVKPARKTRLTAAPTTSIGGSVTGPSGMGSSGIGIEMFRVPAPNASTALPRNTAARPIVAITTAMTGRPISGRNTIRSSPKPSTIIPPIASSAQTQNGAWAYSAAPAARKPANITNSPWAKLIASVAL
jgi:hypothetical protein